MIRWALLILLSPIVATQEPARPNVVLCMADDQGYGDVGYGGHEVLSTPVLDAMARDGLRFDRFYAAAPVCSPTRASVLTGRHPNRMACFSWGHTMRASEWTIAEALREVGYATGHFGKWHLGSVAVGEPTSPGANGFDEWLSSPNFYENSPLMSHRGRVVQTSGESSRVAVDAALRFIETAGRRELPFLCVIWFGNPHTPHVPHEGFADRYADQDQRARNYYAEIAGIDAAMGTLRTGLERLGVRDDTLLWFTSDNGPKLPGSTAGLRGQKGTLWEGGIRVPTVLEWPRAVPTARRIGQPASTVDILPTVLELCGVVNLPPLPLDGESLAAWIVNRARPRRDGLGFWVHPSKGRPVRSQQILSALRDGTDRPEARAQDRIDRSLPGHAAWIDGALKLHRVPRGKQGVTHELYDLDADPAETSDLAPSRPDVVAEMSARLDAWQRDVVRSCERGEPAPATWSDWPMFRGALGTGDAGAVRPPLRWSAQEGVRWRAELPRPANGSAVVSGDAVFLTWAEDDAGARRTLACYDRRSGGQRWTRTVTCGAEMPTHRSNPYGGSTPAATSDRVVVWHASGGLHCYSKSGDTLWSRDLGAVRHMWGYGTSPVIDGGAVILNSGPCEEPFLAAFSLADGSTLWRHDEPPVPAPAGEAGDQRLVGSWTTPVVVLAGDQRVLVATMPTRVLGFDPASGELLWTCDGLRGKRGDLSYSSPVVTGGRCVITGGYVGPEFAVRLGGRGDVTESHREWRRDGRPSSVGSGVAVDGWVWVPAMDGTVACVDPATGERVLTERIGRGQRWNSLVHAGGLVYATNQRGTTVVFVPDPNGPRILATNELGERCNATPAVVDGEVFLRTDEHLWCLGDT